MNLKKIFYLIGVTIMSVSILSSCAKERFELAEKALEDKYHEKYVVEQAGGSIYAGNESTFKVYCHPENDSSLFFKAVIGTDGTVVSDEYDEAVLGNSIKKIIDKHISLLAKDYVSVVNILTSADGFNAGMSVYDYTNSHQTTSYILIAINIDDETELIPEDVYSAITEIYRECGNMKSGLYLYYVDEDKIDEIRNSVNSSPEISSSLVNICGQGFESVVTNGVSVKGLDDLKAALY